MKTTALLLLFLSLGATAQELHKSGNDAPAYTLSDRFPETLQTSAVLQDTIFYNIYGGPNQEEAKDFVETSDKGFLICGSSSSYGQGASSVYVVKADSAGRFKWGRTYGGINADRGMSIRNTPDHGAYITGYSNSFGNFDYDAYCVRIDSAGNMLWYRTYAGNDWDFMYGSEVTADGGLVLAGETYSNTAGDADAYLIRINSVGDTLWTRKFGSAYYESFKSVTVLNDDIYAAGKIFDPATQTTRGFVAHYSASGILLDTLTIPGTATWNYALNGITSSGNRILLAGGIVDPNAATNMQQCEFMLETDSLLAIAWMETGGFSEIKTCNYSFYDNRGHRMAVYTLTGGNGKTAMFLADFNNAGWYVTGSTYGGLEEEEGLKGMITSRNRLAFLGNTYSWGYGDEEYWLVLFKADTLINDHKIKFNYHLDTIALSPIALEELSLSGSALYPNPVSKQGVLSFTQPTDHPFDTAELIDLQGRQIASLSTAHEQLTHFDLGRLGIEAGIYFVRLKGEGTTRTIKIAVQD